MFVFSILDEVSHVHWHLVDARVVELLDVVQRPLVVVRHEVDGHALTAETTATADPKKRGNKTLLNAMIFSAYLMYCLDKNVNVKHQ